MFTLKGRHPIAAAFPTVKSKTDSRAVTGCHREATKNPIIIIDAGTQELESSLRDLAERGLSAVFKNNAQTVFIDTSGPYIGIGK